MDVDVMLCDHAQVAGGKLFISGANIDRMNVVAGAQPPYIVHFAAAGLIHVPWTATNTEHALNFTIVTEDGHIPPLADGVQVGPQGVGGEMRFNVGRPPQLTGGQEQMVPFAFNFQGLPLTQTGGYVLVFSLDGAEVRRVPFTVAADASRGFTGSGSAAPA